MPFPYEMFIEKGVIITTGTFTRDAKAEAANVSKIPIDLTTPRPMYFVHNSKVPMRPTSEIRGAEIFKNRIILGAMLTLIHL